MQDLKIYEIKAIKKNEDGSIFVGERTDGGEGTFVHLTIGPRSAWAIDPATKKLERVASKGRNLVRTVWDKDALYRDVLNGVVGEGTRVSGVAVTMDVAEFEVPDGKGGTRFADSATRFVFEGETLKQAFAGFTLLGDDQPAGFSSIATDIADGEPAQKAPAPAEAVEVD